MDYIPRKPRINEAEAIIMLQTYLRQLSYHDKDIPPVSIDGRYDSATADAVRAFQRKYDLAVNGEVDLATWELLKKKYDESVLAHSPSERLEIFPAYPDGYSYGPETKDFGVSILQYMLGELSRLYSFDDIEINGVYDAPTRQSVTEFQIMNGLSPSGRVDRQTWDKMASQYNRLLRQYDE